MPTALKNQLPLFSSNVPVEHLSTNRTGNLHGVQRWANFIAGYTIEFAQQCILSDGAAGLVLDPFLGCGTTSVAARTLGLPSVGYEPHPVFGALSVAKCSIYSLGDLDLVEQVFIKDGLARPLSESASKFLNKMFAPTTLNRLLVASLSIEDLDKRLQPLAVAVLLKTSETACGSQTDGIYKAPTSKKNASSFDEALGRSLAIFREDIGSPWYDEFMEAPSTVWAHSSESMPELKDNSISCCITSPPYLNNFDFAEMTRMQLYLLGWAESWGDITDKVRSVLLTNTTTALKGKKTEAYQSESRAGVPCSLVSELDSLVDSLSEEKSGRAGKKEYDYLVYPYYNQISNILKECYRVLKPGARVHWVVSDAALYGHYVATHEHTLEIAERVGFSSTGYSLLRKRGHRWKLAKRDGAPGRLGEYYLTMTK